MPNLSVAVGQELRHRFRGGGTDRNQCSGDIPVMREEPAALLQVKHLNQGGYGWLSPSPQGLKSTNRPRPTRLALSVGDLHPMLVAGPSDQFLQERSILCAVLALEDGQAIGSHRANGFLRPGITRFAMAF